MAWGNDNRQGNGGGRGNRPKFEHKQNRGSIWDNDHKTTPKHPDFQGQANIDGVMYWVSGWTEMKNNKRMMSLSFKRQDERPQEPRRQSETPVPRGGW